MRLLFLLVLLVSPGAFGQDYAKVDQKVSTYPSTFSDGSVLSKRIKSDFSSEEQQVRAAFTWLANHIVYDINEYQYINYSGKIIYETEEELQEKLRAIDLKVINRAWKHKRTVCEGYSLIFKEICDDLGIISDVIRGYTKTQPKEIGTNREAMDHIWNAVQIDGEWKLVDTTWASGYLSGNGWNHEFNDGFFFADPERLILTHFPKYEKWQLQENKVTKKEFFSYPVYYSHAFFYDLSLSNPYQGTIKISSENTIILRFKDIPENIKIFYAFDSELQTRPLIFTTKNGYYETIIPAKKDPYLTLYINNVSVLDFKISD